MKKRISAKVRKRAEISVLPVLQFIVQKFVPRRVINFLQEKTIYDYRKRILNISENNTPLFDSVFFEVRTKCNGTCPFCAASIQNETREDTNMPFDLYKKVIDELKELNYSGRIAYHVNNDPLIFLPLIKFVGYARKHLPNAWLQVLTNGKALTLEKAESLLAAEINELSINYYNDDFSAELPEVFRRVRNEIIPRFYRPEQIKSGHYEDYSKPDKNAFVFNIFHRRLTEILSTRAGTSPNKKEKARIPRGFCELPFTQIQITTNGTVAKCSSDHFVSDVMGNVKNQSLVEIWNNEKFRDVRCKLLKGNRDAIETCRKCDFYGCHDVHSKRLSVISKLVYYVTA